MFLKCKCFLLVADNKDESKFNSFDDSATGSVSQYSGSSIAQSTEIQSKSQKVMYPRNFVFLLYIYLFCFRVLIFHKYGLVNILI